MVFLKHQHVFYTEQELKDLSLYAHTERCTLTETQMHAPPKRHRFYMRHQGHHAFPKAYATTEMGFEGTDRRVTDGARWSKTQQAFEGALHSAKRQDEAVQKTLDMLEESPHGGAVLSLPCGWGKTVCAIALACILRRKTFILVHTQFLAQQWADRCRQFISNCNVFMWEKTVELDQDRESHVTIGLMQTVHKYPSFYFSNYGLLVIDECHHVPCSTLQKCLPRFNARYTLGLSATPYRKDGLSQYIFWAIGNISLQIKPRYPLVHVHQIPTLARGARHQSLEDQLMNDEDRNKQVVSVVQNVLRQGAGRKVLVLTSRRHHATLLHDLLQPHAVLMLGGGANNLAHVSTYSVIVATYQLVSEGFDMPDLNTLVLALPKTDLVQCIGRITRGADSTVQPWVIDFVDRHVSEAYYKSQRRTQLYRSLDMRVHSDSKK